MPRSPCPSSPALKHLAVRAASWSTSARSTPSSATGATRCSPAATPSARTRRVEVARAGEPVGPREFLAELDAQLGRIQQELFDLGAELATPGATEGKAPLRVEEADITRLEQELDAWNADLPPLRSFILPGGGPLGASAHLARTVCRRAERTVVALSRVEPVRGEAVRYLNRLSDYFFVVARAVAHRFGVPEVLWDTRRRSPAP
jgi:cob(I)alamin adenosyltransferase